MQRGIEEMLCFQASQWYILFRVAMFEHEVLEMLDELGVEVVHFMDYPKLMGFGKGGMKDHEFVKLIQEARRSGDATFVHWSSGAALSKLTKQLSADLNFPIMAPEGSKRARKAPEMPPKLARKSPSAKHAKCMQPDHEQPDHEQPDHEQPDHDDVVQPADEELFDWACLMDPEAATMGGAGAPL